MCQALPCSRPPAPLLSSTWVRAIEHATRLFPAPPAACSLPTADAEGGPHSAAYPFRDRLLLLNGMVSLPTPLAEASPPELLAEAVELNHQFLRCAGGGGEGGRAGM